jgi:hypothetical protein
LTAVVFPGDQMPRHASRVSGSQWFRSRGAPSAAGALPWRPSECADRR